MSKKMTKTEAAEIIARHVVAHLLASDSKDGKTAAQEIVSEFRAGHRGGWLQYVARTNGYEVRDIARVIRACKARVADLQAAARDRETARRLGG